nr:hypothetical protein HK105_002996 [Polyrhizophydium stewartii]
MYRPLESDESGWPIHGGACRGRDERDGLADHRAAIGILRRVLGHVCTLGEFVRLEPPPPDLPALLAGLLSKTIVAYTDATLRERQPPPTPREPGFQRPLPEILSGLISRMISTNNLLTYGFREMNDRATGALSHGSHVENYYPNSLVAEIKSRPWRQLLEVALVHLLRTTSIFVRASRGNLVQLTANVTQAPACAIRPSSILIPWSRILYGKPSFTNRRVRHVGFPRSHVFTFIGRQQDEACQQIAKEMFPLQFGLPLVPEAASVQGTLAREKQFGSTTKTAPSTKPKRQRTDVLAPLIERTLSLARKCNYAALLDHYCPEPQKTAVKVAGFVKAVVRRIIPHELWGSDENRDAVFSKIVQAVLLRRRETLSLQNIIDGIKKRRELMLQFLYWLFVRVIIPLIKVP